MNTCSKPCSNVSMRTRRRCDSGGETAEHPFATLKMRMGTTHFLMKRLPKVAIEMALHVGDRRLFAYELRTVLTRPAIKPDLGQRAGS